jgi:hypothetical protein
VEEKQMAIVTTQAALKTAGALFLALSVASTAAARGDHDRDARSSDGNGSAFSLGACRWSSPGHFQFSNSRSPFRGATGGGSYGDVFFAGGGTPRSRTSAGSSDTQPFGNNNNNNNNNNNSSVTSPPSNGGAAGTGGSGSGTNGNGTSGAPGYTGGSGSGPGTVPTHPIGQVPVTVGGGGAALPPGAAPTGVGGTPAVNPEPASMLLIGTGLGALFLGRRRRTRN